MKVLMVIVSLMCLVGCATMQIDSSVSRFRSEAAKIKLGDKKEDVLAILLPTQKDLPSDAAKSAESFMKDKDLIEIYYFRSGRQPDGLTTDDEFTPYIFTNGVLSGIGWTVLGGAKSQGQVIQPPAQIQQTTIVH